MAGEIEKVIGKHGVYYRVRVELPPKPNGKRNQKTLTDKSYKGLEKQQRDLLHQIDWGQFSVAPAKMALGEFLNYYLDIIKGRRINTYMSYAQTAEAFRKYLGNVLLSELRADMVQRVVNNMAGRLKKTTVFYRFQKFTTMMKYAVGMDYILKIHVVV